MIERKSKRVSQKGFTLIELAIVLGVIAILTA
ncbi:TPA: prepilin-type N-terminal cleavage/methylation domain-containing protein, partial [Pseudomonas aeruginosa]|nr:prepilin-type N-terminal cleavage/methylation domain-containing protein [Pseudomonas aeruginosa]